MSNPRTWDRELTAEELTELPAHCSCDYCHKNTPTRLRFFDDGVSFLACPYCAVGGG